MSRNFMKLRRLRLSLGCNATAGDAYHKLKPRDKVNRRKFDTVRSKYKLRIWRRAIDSSVSVLYSIYTKRVTAWLLLS